MAIIISTAVPGFVEASENVRREILHNDSSRRAFWHASAWTAWPETIELDQENISSKLIDSEIPRLFCRGRIHRGLVSPITGSK
jgi:hypothetical protein